MNVEVVVHPLLFLYVMIVVPALMLVTKPVFETVAIVVADEVHAFVGAAVPLPVYCDVAPTHADNIPLIVGLAFTV